MRILIAEDERITRMTLARQLAGVGPRGDGGRGRAAGVGAVPGRRSSTSSSPTGRCRGCPGVELVRRIREAPRAAYTYVIILTSRSDKSDVVSGIEAGADDFVSKPFDREELRVRLLAGERIVRLERALSQQNAELRDANERIRHGLRAAARVQQSMLPQQNVVTPHVRTAWKYVPTDELAGDAIGLHLIDDRYLVAYVLDVSGHGVPAALLSVTAMHALEPMPAGDVAAPRHGRGATTATWAPSSVRRGSPTELNRRFRAGENDGRYLTMVLCVLDTLTRHNSTSPAPATRRPFLLRGGDALPRPGRRRLSRSPWSTAPSTKTAVVQLRPGDRVCLYSDGIIEQTAGAGEEQFGAPRILQSLASRGTVPAEALLTGVLDDFGAGPGRTRLRTTFRSSSSNGSGAC